jgi:hypothetical protein
MIEMAGVKKFQGRRKIQRRLSMNLRGTAVIS